MEKPEKKEINHNEPDSCSNNVDANYGYNEGLEAGLAYHNAKIAERDQENKRLHEEMVELSKDKRDLMSHLDSIKGEHNAKIHPVMDIWDRMTAVDEPWEDRIDPEEIEQAIRQLAEGK